MKKLLNKITNKIEQYYLVEEITDKGYNAIILQNPDYGIQFYKEDQKGEDLQINDLLKATFKIKKGQYYLKEFKKA